MKRHSCCSTHFATQKRHNCSQQNNSVVVVNVFGTTKGAVDLNLTEDLKRQNLLSNRAGFLCYKCYEEVSTWNGNDLKNKALKAQELSSQSTDDRLADILTELIDIIEATPFDKLYGGKESLWGNLYKLLGEKLSSRIYNDNKTLESLYKQQKLLIDLNIPKFLKERNNVTFVYVWLDQSKLWQWNQLSLVCFCFYFGKMLPST